MITNLFSGQSRVRYLRKTLSVLRDYLAEISPGVLSRDGESERLRVLRETEFSGHMLHQQPAYDDIGDRQLLIASIRKCFRIIDALPQKTSLPAVMDIVERINAPPGRVSRA